MLASSIKFLSTVEASDPRPWFPHESVYGTIIALPERSIQPLLYAMGLYIPNLMLGAVYETAQQNFGLHAHLRDVL